MGLSFTGPFGRDDAKRSSRRSVAAAAVLCSLLVSRLILCDLYIRLTESIGSGGRSAFLFIFLALYSSCSVPVIDVQRALWYMGTHDGLPCTRRGHVFVFVWHITFRRKVLSSRRGGGVIALTAGSIKKLGPFVFACHSHFSFCVVTYVEITCQPFGNPPNKYIPQKEPNTGAARAQVRVAVSSRM